MTLQQIIQLGVRILAIFVGTESFDYLIKIPGKMEGINSPQHYYVAYAMGIFYLFIAVCLWKFPSAISNRVIQKSEQNQKISLNAFDFARAGSGLVGLWLFTSSLPSISWFLFRGATYAMTNESIVSALDPEDRIRLGYYFIQLIISIFTIVKADFVAKIIMNTTKVRSDKDT